MVASFLKSHIRVSKLKGLIIDHCFDNFSEDKKKDTNTPFLLQKSPVNLFINSV